MTFKIIKNIAIGAAVVSLAATTFTTSAFAQSAGWSQQVARVLASKQSYPRTAQMRGEEGTARVKITVAANGSVEKTELVSPSGSAALDREALAIPARAGTLPAPPGGSTSVTVPLTWKLL